MSVRSATATEATARKLSGGSGAPPATPATALELRDVAVRYGEREILRGVTLSVAPGTVYALLGRNGSGKPSLIRCLLGQQLPQRGRARLLGFDSWAERPAALGRIGVVPEEPDAPPHLTPRELADLCSELYPSWSPAAVEARFTRFGVPRDTAFAQLSKGQKGHTLLALALGHEPELLVLDDPTLGLDAVARRAVFDELIGELAERGTTVLLASHDLEGVERIAERVGILHGGGLVVDESLEQLKARFRRLRCPRDLEGSELEAHGMLALRDRPWGRDALVQRFDAARFAAQAQRLDLTAEAVPLEEIFLALAGEGSAGAP